MVDRTIGERLGMYVGDGPDKTMSIRSFAAEMLKRRPRPKGSTRAMIHRYLAGATPPSEFTSAAAQVLELNPEWLAFEIGHPTPAHAEAAAVSSGAAPRGADWKRESAARLLHTIFQFMRVPQSTEDVQWWRSPESLIPHWVAPLGEVRLRLVLGGTYNVRDLLGMRDPRGDLPGSSYIDPHIERDIGAALKGPLDVFRVDPNRMEGDTLGDYITAMVPVLLAIEAEQRRQQPDMTLGAGQEMVECIPRRSRARPKGSKQRSNTPRSRKGM
ncbi:MAG: hypothetical protein H0W30_01205 [Gemmatimonadaceae bacterium]|nr:hypothetical protein [Gemmatimonadaceae bacterium]MBA3557193.1 hypothetical protein [Gemmatimonadaceae bacterium]